MNLYEYVQNNPINYLDPFGLETKQPPAGQPNTSLGMPGGDSSYYTPAPVTPNPIPSEVSPLWSWGPRAPDLSPAERTKLEQKLEQEKEKTTLAPAPDDYIPMEEFKKMQAERWAREHGMHIMTQEEFNNVLLWMVPEGRIVSPVIKIGKGLLGKVGGALRWAGKALGIGTKTEKAVQKGIEKATQLSKSQHSIDLSKGKRIDLKGRDPKSSGHFNKTTQTQHGYPHVHDPKAPGGVRDPRPSDYSEIGE
jgi:hypothetical protein